MDHEEAMLLRAAERYLLGDLSVSEVEEYERHFFDCSQCSEELRTLAILKDNARAVLLEQTPAPEPIIAARQSEAVPARASLPEPKASWWSGFGFRWAGALAGVAVAIFAGYELGSRNAADSPQPVSAFPLYSAARGDETVVSPPAGAKFYSLYLDKTWDGDFVSYRAAFHDVSGAEKFSMSIPPLPPGRAVYILAPANALPAGKYVLIIYGTDRGGKETEAARFPFTLSFK